MTATARTACRGSRRVEGPGITEIEPHAAGLAALHSPATAITDFGAIAEAYGDDISWRRVVASCCRATSPASARRGGAIEVPTPGGAHRLDQLVICAGLQADRVSSWVDGEAGPRIVPFRGEYMAVRRRRSATSSAA